MTIPITGRIVIWLLVGFTLVGMAAGIVTAQPSISLSINGEEVSPGATIQTQNDPDLDVSVEANSTIELVEIRIDGERRKGYNPDSESFSETLTLDLDNGEHDLEVIVSAEETETFEASIVKDSAGPFIEYTNPFQTPDRTSPPDSTTVGEATVTLSGDLIDDTGVESIRIERTFEYDYAGQEQSREFYEINNPENSFSQELLLGDGENEIKTRYVDELGNIRRHEFSLVVRDQTAPRINLSVPSETGASEVTLEGTVSDNVKIQTITVSTASQGSKEIVSERSPEPDEDRLSIDIEEAVTLSEGRNEVVVEATDNSGNTETQEFEVVYNRNIAPEIVIDCAQTRFENDQIAVRGHVEQGEITSVTVESIDTEAGDRIDITNVYNGDGTNRVEIDDLLTVAAGETRVRVLVTDSQDDQHEISFTVNPETQGRFLDGNTDCDPVTPTAVETSPETSTTTETQTQSSAGDTDSNDISRDSGDTPSVITDDGSDSTDAGASRPGFTISGRDFIIMLGVVVAALVAVRLTNRG